MCRSTVTASSVNYNIDSHSFYRQSKDVIVDTRGRSLIDICIGNQLRILNGRCFGDMFGRHTCFIPNGCSVVDYTIVSESVLDQILFSHVSDFLATLSDCHCKLSWGMLANFTCSNNSYMLNPLPLKYIWNETSITDFQSAFERDEIKSKITSFINLSITDTQDATTVARFLWDYNGKPLFKDRHIRKMDQYRQK